MFWRGVFQLGVLTLGTTDPGPATPAPARRPFGLCDEEMVVARGQAYRLHCERGDPLVDDETGEVLAAGRYAA